MRSLTRIRGEIFGNNSADKRIRDSMLEEIKDKLRKDMNLDEIRVEARGSNGHVLGAGAHGREMQGIAVKVVTKWNVSEGEKCFWPTIKHQRLLPLLQHNYLNETDVHAFISPLQACNLETFLKEDAFVANKDGLNMIKTWIKDILSGLKHLHKEGYCHLGINASSVLLTSEQSAVLGDFHSMDKIGRPTDRYELPYRDRPPEVYQNVFENNKIQTEGSSFDIWCIGLLTLKILTGNCFKSKIPLAYHNWSEDVYPHLFKVLQKKYFLKKCRKLFPACRINREIAEIMRNFVMSCMQLHPKDRPSAAALEKHRFFVEEGWMDSPTSLWSKKEKATQLAQKILEIRCHLPHLDKNLSTQKTAPENQPLNTAVEEAGIEHLQLTTSKDFVSVHEEIKVELSQDRTDGNKESKCEDRSCTDDATPATETSDEMYYHYLVRRKSTLTENLNHLQDCLKNLPDTFARDSNHDESEESESCNEESKDFKEIFKEAENVDRNSALPKTFYETFSSKSENQISGNLKIPETSHEHNYECAPNETIKNDTKDDHVRKISSSDNALGHEAAHARTVYETFSPRSEYQITVNVKTLEHSPNETNENDYKDDRVRRLRLSANALGPEAALPNTVYEPFIPSSEDQINRNLKTPELSYEDNSKYVPNATNKNVDRDNNMCKPSSSSSALGHEAEAVFLETKYPISKMSTWFRDKAAFLRNLLSRRTRKMKT